ncbi:MAG TPA: aminotransferase class III-fold pyridoxal phosphate-dependent enzyme, partial [Steroidobacteraceae bacterium]
KIYEDEQLLTRARKVGGVFEQAVHALRELPHVIDIRNYGLVAGIELEPIAGSPGARAFGVYLKCFERGLLIRTTGDIIALSPSLIIEDKHLDELIGVLSQAIRES